MQLCPSDWVSVKIRAQLRSDYHCQQAEAEDVTDIVPGYARTSSFSILLVGPLRRSAHSGRLTCREQAANVIVNDLRLIGLWHRTCFAQLFGALNCSRYRSSQNHV